MTYDDIATCFRDLAGHLTRGHAEVAPGDVTSVTTPITEQPPQSHETTADLLARMWRDPREQRRLLTCKSAEDVAFLISTEAKKRGATQVKRSATWHKHICVSLAAVRLEMGRKRDEEREKERR